MYMKVDWSIIFSARNQVVKCIAEIYIDQFYDHIHEIRSRYAAISLVKSYT